jgi:hydrogenase expression/formation protein HypC
MCLAVPGEILSVDEADPLMRKARVRFGGIVKEVSLALLPEARPGQYVLVHAGVGISVINEAEAARTFEYLEQIGDLDELREAPS